MAKNKIIYGSEVLIDLTADTVSPNTLLKDATAHDKSGEVITGECTFDSDTSDATVAVAEMLVGKTAYARGAKVTGTMPNIGGMTDSIKSKEQIVAVPLGFHDGSGTVAIDADEQAKIIAGNIKKDITILGITGSYGGEEIHAQDKTVVPKITAQQVLPDENYDYLSSVTVNAIPYSETPNAAGGITVTIAGE